MARQVSLISYHLATLLPDPVVATSDVAKSVTSSLTQRKFTEGDLIMLNSDLGIDIGTRITIDKVTLVGSRDFTLMGRPVLPRDLARVEATVVEKNLSKTEVSHPVLELCRFLKIRNCEIGFLWSVLEMRNWV